MRQTMARSRPLLQLLSWAAFRALAIIAVFGFAELGTHGNSRAEESPPSSSPAPAEPPKPSWDQAANIRQAAEHLGQLQRTRGAKGAYDYIAACYRTQGLASDYAAPFEACIAQDYMQTQVLALIYSRLKPEQLKTMHAPTPPELADAMGRRVVAAFSQYKIQVSYANDFKKLVDQHGFPVFLNLVFPNTKLPSSPSAQDKDGLPHLDGKPSGKP